MRIGEVVSDFIFGRKWQNNIRQIEKMLVLLNETYCHSHDSLPND